MHLHALMKNFGKQSVKVSLASKTPLTLVACGRVGWEAKIHTNEASKDELHAAITQRKLEKLLECPNHLNCTMNTSAATELVSSRERTP